LSKKKKGLIALVGSKKGNRKGKNVWVFKGKVKNACSRNRVARFKFRVENPTREPEHSGEEQDRSEAAIQYDSARFPFDLTCDHQKPIPAIFRHGAP
jgi:hypothetical protein